MNARVWFAVMVVALACTAVHAQKVYKWVDADGRVSYHDQPPPSDSGYRVEEKTVRVGVKAEITGAAAEAAAKNPVVLYITPKCESCDVARMYLQKRGVPFSEKNVEGNRQLQDELIKQAGGLAVPTITVGAKVMRGYLESLLDGELTAAGYPGKDAEPEPEKKEEKKE